jgi:ABC-type uncharacterized transport system permease subunit
MAVDPTLTAIALAYTVAWLLEASRLFSRSAGRGLAVLGLVGGGFVAETCYLGFRTASATGSPLSSSFDWCLLAGWLLVASYLYLTIYHPRNAIGLVVLPLVLLLIVAAALFADRRPIAPQPASQLWGAIHGIFLLLGTVTVMIGFAAGVLYLVQAARLKRKLPAPSGLRLPSLEWLDRINSRVVVISVILVAIGFLAGVVLNVAARGDRELSWSDPVISSSALMLAWLVAAALFEGFYKPARHGRKVAYLTVASFGFLLLALGTLLLVDTRHGGQRAGRLERPSPIPAETAPVKASGGGP